MTSQETSRALAEFFKWAMEASWACCELDGGDVHDKAEALGLLKIEPYDPEKHGESDCGVEPGDEWNTLSDGVKELLE